MERSGQQTVLVTGASSQLGVFVIPRLLQSGFRVIALSRKATTDLPEGPGGLLWIHPRVLGIGDPCDSPEVRMKVDMLLSCGPLKLALEAVRMYCHLERIVVFCTTSVFSSVTAFEKFHTINYVRFNNTE